MQCSQDERLSLCQEEDSLNKTTFSLRTGIARIKPEYIVERGERDMKSVADPPTKKRKKNGRNQNRPVYQGSSLSEKICPSIIKEKQCNYGESCKFCHDIAKFMSMKPPDIGDNCYVFEKYGRCPQGIACRYGSKHIDKDFNNLVNESLYEKGYSDSTINILDKNIQKLLWKKKYDFTKANKNVKIVQDWYKQRKVTPGVNNKETIEVKGCTSDQALLATEQISEKSELGNETCTISCDRNKSNLSLTQLEVEDMQSGCVTDEDIVRLRPSEKKKVDFNGKLYLAPLTTVGNLPFRRICKKMGADITCSEMAVATNLLQANQSEWALLKRHSSEDVFGVQLCGAYPDTMTRCAQLLNDETCIDFVDINCGCPIDLVYKRGEGASLMSKPNKLEQIVKSMVTVLNVPLTVKMRTGIASEKPVAHSLIPRLKTWGVSQMTLHGRSREQRYTRLADWNYIDRCAQLAVPIPLFGNGDILSYEEYYKHLNESAVSGIMIARGALIKPWIFTEIKEQRNWDISASERFDILKDFVNFGLDHWGSDQQGVENVRRFLLEQLSFSYRYIPVGLLERIPQEINARPPPYRGRNDLETLLSSPSCLDWIKISEMLLGPVPNGFSFLPKHKANSYN